MIEPELGLFKMQVEGTLTHASKLGQPHLGYSPEVLNAIDLILLPLRNFPWELSKKLVGEQNTSKRVNEFTRIPLKYVALCFMYIYNCKQLDKIRVLIRVIGTMKKAI